MKYVTWSNQYALGLPEIDAQHKELLSIINELWAYLVAPPPLDLTATQSVLDQLVIYTQSHFVAEETLMRVQDYPEFKAHIDEHKDFIAHLQSAKTRLVDEPASALNLLMFLKDWLIRHIDGSDRLYVDYFLDKKKTGIGMFSRFFRVLRGR